MSTLNKVIIVGNLGQDPELKKLPSGSAVCNVSLATKETWKDKATGDKKEKTEWHRVVFFGRTAEVVAQYATKGRSILVEGRNETRKYTDKDGVERYVTEVIASEMTLMSGGREATPQPPPQQAKFEDEDIPF